MVSFRVFALHPFADSVGGQHPLLLPSELMALNRRIGAKHATRALQEQKA
jgi:hypothetical protein